MKLVFEYLKPYRLNMLWGLIIRFLSSVMDLFLPMILAHLIDNVVPASNRGDLGTILLWGLLMIACSTFAFYTSIHSNRIAVKIARDTAQKLRLHLFSRCMYLSRGQIDNIGISSLESRLTSDTYMIHNMLNQVQRIGVRAPILFLGGIIIAFIMDARLSLILIATVPFISLSTLLISRRGIPLHFAASRAEDEMVAVVRENAQGVRIIKALSKTEYEKERFDKANLSLTQKEAKASIAMAANSPIINLILNLGLCAIILLGAYQVNVGITKAGTIIAFLNYFTIISNATIMITRVFLTLTRGIASARRIEEVINTPTALSKLPAEIPAKKSESFIEFRSVAFSYEKKKENLRDVSFALKKGQTLGIIGATGSGKTTLISLLMRLWDADRGSILIGGQDIRSLRPDELLSKFGTVMQNDFIFAGTIEENIDFFRGLDADKIKRAAEIAQAAPFIEALDDGYAHALTSKGTNISGGQRQRILIARAIAAEPEILIFDDSSSALDYKTDAALRARLADAMPRGTTQIVIAQRVSSIMNADLIVVLDGGAVSALGTHSELLASCPLYREISDSQIGGVSE